METRVTINMKSTHCKLGFSLVEAIISMALLGITLSSFLVGITAMIKNAYSVSINNSVQALISSEIKRIRTMTYTPGTGVFSDIDPDDTADDYVATVVVNLPVDKDDQTKVLPITLTTTITGSYASYHVLVEAQYSIVGRTITQFQEFAVNQFTGVS